MPQLPSLGSYLELSDGASSPTFDEVAFVESWSQDDPGTPEIPTTHLRSTSREYLFALPDDGTLTLNVFLDPDDASHEEIRDIRDSRTTRTWKLNLTDGTPTVGTFDATVSQFSRAAGGPDTALRATIQLRITGGIAWA